MKIKTEKGTTEVRFKDFVAVEPKFGDLCGKCGEPLDPRDVEFCLLWHEGCLDAVVLGAWS